MRSISIRGATIIQGYAFRILAMPDGKRQADFAKDTEVVGMRVFTPASLLLFLAALGMMINLDWPWGQNWIVLGLIASASRSSSASAFWVPRAAGSPR